MTKQSLRERVWDDLEDSGVARFPFPPHGRIPNFEGADRAAERLDDVEAWRTARTLKANPDAPQLPARRRALHAGRTVYLARPRLRDADPFLELDPDELADLDRAPTVSSDAGRPVGADAVPDLDCVLVGSVAVTTRGARVGKGEGFSDLEYAVLRELGAVDGDTPVLTTVHERQVVDDDVPVEPHDVPVDYVVTPERVVATETSHDRPDGVDWAALDPERLDEVPMLARLREKEE